MFESDLFICWEFSKESPQQFITQDEIVVDYILPNLNHFKEFIRHFYVTKINYTNVRLQVFFNKSFIQKADYIQNLFSELTLINKMGPKLINIVENYGPLEKELEFREFLTDISFINLDLHNHISQAKSIGCKTRINMKNGEDIRSCLSNYFFEYSQHFKKLVATKKDELFWKRIQYKFNGKTPWDHFYFNPILGFDF